MEKKRYDEKVPPGYKDQNKEDPYQYGDLVIWKQVIEYAKEIKKPIILITDERKEDWWLRREGKTLGPRPELINEIATEANVLFYMYTTDPFMSQAREYLKRLVDQKAIEEVQETRKQDEKYQEILETQIRLDPVQDMILAKNKRIGQIIVISEEKYAQMTGTQQSIPFYAEKWEQLTGTSKSLPISKEQLAQMTGTPQYYYSTKVETSEREIDEENKITSGPEIDKSELETEE